MTVDQVIAGFPASLFLTLVGLTLMFSVVPVKGKNERITHKAVSRAAGSPGVIPFVFFFLTNILASVGPGHIAATALMAPLAMAAAGRYGIPAFLMAIMVANGASSGSLSPIAPTGVVVEGITTMKLGMGDVRWAIYFNNLIGHLVIAWTGYLLLGGWKLLRRRDLPPEGGSHKQDEAQDAPLNWKQWLTCAIILGLVASVIFLKLNVGLAAFAGAAIITLLRAADETAAVKAMPWGVIMMVSGVTLLVSMVEKAGGMALFAGFLGRLATPGTVTAVAAFFSGLISIYSSTIAVVLPSLLPT